MRRFGAIFIIVVALLAMGMAVRVFGANQTVTGQLIDLACYTLDKENVGLHHRNRGLDCARACAKEGFQVGLLTSDGKAYHIIGNLAANKNAKLWPHMAQTVTVTGTISEENGQTMIAGRDLEMSK
jgi:hypothetical protein